MASLILRWLSHDPFGRHRVTPGFGDEVRDKVNDKVRDKAGREITRLARHLAFVLLFAISALACPAAETAPAERVYLFDARYLRGLDLSKAENAIEVWDTMHVLSALQGLANREKPQLYILYCADFGVETDEFWWDWLRGEDGWLKDCQVIKVSSLEDLIQKLRSHVNGAVIYDPNVPATSNLASTAAGCEGLLPLRYSTETNSLFVRLTQHLNIEPKLWLLETNGAPLFTGKGTIPGTRKFSTGSAKCDAYLWGLQRWVESGQCDARFAAYYLDAFWLQCPRNGPGDLHTLSNHDYFIARRAFFFDLSPWGDESPNDDKSQELGADKRTFLRVMRTLYTHTTNSMIKVGGFTPWPYKYTDHFGGGKHGGVPTEWEFGRLISQYNGYMEADAAGPGAMANASFYSHYPLKPKYPQPNRKPSPDDWLRNGYLTTNRMVAPKLYVGHYVGDYDSPSWLYKAVPRFFSDASRGRVPLGWAFDPSLADRAPQVFAYVYRHATSNDFFIAGDSGAGYLNPRGLVARPDSKLSPALSPWIEHCKRYYEQFDMSITGFVLDGSSGASTRLEFNAYRQFSPDGCGTHFEKEPRIISGVPTCPERDLPDSPEAAADLISSLAGQVTDRAQFLWGRSILKPPSWYAAVSQLVAEKHPTLPVAFVDPYTFFALVRRQAETPLKISSPLNKKDR